MNGDTQALTGLIVISIFLFLYLLEFVTGKITRSQRPMRDLLFTLAGISAHSVLSGAVVGTLTALIVRVVFPGNADLLSGVGFWVAFPILFVSIEFCHYWIHRWAHEYRWMWKLHRTHHSATDLNTSVLFRYNIFWVLLLPQVWFGGMAIYLGMPEAFMAAVLTTYSVNALTHTSFRWDLWLRQKLPWSEPAWQVIERVVTLPDTHHAHHAWGKKAHPNGNYAVTLFLFDTIFGTAKIPNTRQTNYGLPISHRLPWQEELFWPLVKKPLLPRADENNG